MNKTILIVDDEKDFCTVLSESLSRDKYRVVTAFNGETALRLAKKENPDLMLLDIKMPGMDGIELLRRVREIHRDLPIIICTAYGEYKYDFGTWAGDAYLTKSADLTELKGKIRELLGDA